MEIANERVEEIDGHDVYKVDVAISPEDRAEVTDLEDLGLHLFSILQLLSRPLQVSACRMLGGDLEPESVEVVCDFEKQLTMEEETAARFAQEVKKRGGVNWLAVLDLAGIDPIMHISFSWFITWVGDDGIKHGVETVRMAMTKKKGWEAKDRIALFDMEMDWGQDDGYNEL